MSAAPDPERQLLRHALATIAYRGAKPLRGASPDFGTVQIPNYPRPPIKILAHINDLFDWALSISKGEATWRDSAPLHWSGEVTRFFHGIKALDDYLLSGETLHESPAKLLQGPLADALTHIGQLALLRRLSGQPIKGENYFKAQITVGRLGPDQEPPRREFD
jgi:hypothetical protein